MWLSIVLYLSAFTVIAISHDTYGTQTTLRESQTEPWASKYGDAYDQPYSGLLSFSHLPYKRCLDSEYIGTALFDIAVLGLPFDTAVSYRPGARFGPHAIRSGSRRQRSIRGYTLAWGLNPYMEGSDIIDCGKLSG
jgi:agmatinase